jgi:hypothetical protein
MDRSSVLQIETDGHDYCGSTCTLGMDGKRKLAGTLVCAGLAFVGAFHFVLSTAFGYGLRPVGAGLVAAALFGLVVIYA